RKLRDDATAWSVSPDGTSIAFTTDEGQYGDRQAWLMGPDGEQARKLFDTDANSFFADCRCPDVGSPRGAWSPDGQRLVYAKEFHSPDKVEQVIESRDLKGGPAITLLKSGPRNAKGGIRGFYWLPDGRILYSQRDPDVDEASCNYWEIPVDAR